MRFSFPIIFILLEIMTEKRNKKQEK